MKIDLQWRRCADYRDFIATPGGVPVVYAFYLGDVLTYVGKSSVTSWVGVRYSAGYSHLFHAYTIYAAIVPADADLDSVERTLIRNLNPLLNRARKAPAVEYAVNGPLREEAMIKALAAESYDDFCTWIDHVEEPTE